MVDVNILTTELLFVPFAAISVVAYTVYLMTREISTPIPTSHSRERALELTVKRMQMRRLKRESFRLFLLSYTSGFIIFILFWISQFSQILTIPVEAILVAYGLLLGAMINRFSEILRLRRLIRRRRPKRRNHINRLEFWTGLT